MIIYITSPLDTSMPNWPRMQAAAVDRVLGAVAVQSFGVDLVQPWMEIEAADLPKIVAPVLYRTNRVLTKLSFRRLFTMPERIAFDNFESNENLTAEQKAALRTIAKDFEMAGEIDMGDPDTASGLAFLEAIGIIAGGRAAQILA